MANSTLALSIDSQAHCYEITTGEINNLQRNIASSVTLEQGTYDIQLSSGRYRHPSNINQGIPLILLWIDGVDGSTFKMN